MYYIFSDRVGLEDGDEEAEDCYDSAPESDECDEEINVTQRERERERVAEKQIHRKLFACGTFNISELVREPKQQLCLKPYENGDRCHSFWPTYFIDIIVK